jgi:hypothetical protein
MSSLSLAIRNTGGGGLSIKTIISFFHPHDSIFCNRQIRRWKGIKNVVGSILSGFASFGRTKFGRPTFHRHSVRQTHSRPGRLTLDWSTSRHTDSTKCRSAKGSSTKRRGAFLVRPALASVKSAFLVSCRCDKIFLCVTDANALVK